VGSSDAIVRFLTDLFAAGEENILKDVQLTGYHATRRTTARLASKEPQD
jgi:hypothetical protein